MHHHHSTTFYTPFERYKFLRMPLSRGSVKTSFERKIDQTYESCKGAAGITDDVQVFGNEETHDSMFQEAKECMEKTGILHSFDKCIIKTRCCSFGKQYTPEGVKSDMKEVPIKQMQPPINKQQMKFTSRYGEPLIYSYAKYFLLNFRSESFPEE